MTVKIQRGRQFLAGDATAQLFDAKGKAGSYLEKAAEKLAAQTNTLTLRSGSTTVKLSTADEWKKFLSEHAHDDDEDRYFAKGAGVFYLHANEKVHAVYCEAGDLISVPANTTHWFDMGTAPHYVSVRFFHDDDGWVGHFTGSPIAESFATFDQLAERRAQLA